MAIPDGAESARAFLPAKDFEISKAFYRALGFTTLLDGDVAIFGVGAGAFILQRYYQKDWAENCMMQLMVDDLDAWWAHIEALDLPATFGVQPPRPPAVQPWGLRVAYVFDPCGVLWHIARPRGVRAGRVLPRFIGGGGPRSGGGGAVRAEVHGCAPPLSWPPATS